jgi:hypothetical protein
VLSVRGDLTHGSPGTSNYRFTAFRRPRQVAKSDY